MIVVPDFVWTVPLVLNSGFTISTKYCSEWLQPLLEMLMPLMLKRTHLVLQIFWRWCWWNPNPWPSAKMKWQVNNAAQQSMGATSPGFCAVAQTFHAETNLEGLRDSRGSNSPPPATPVSSTIVSARPDWHSMPSSHGRAFWFKSLMDPRKYAWHVLFFVGHPFFQQVLPALIDLIRSKLVYVELDKEIVQESGHFFF